MNDSFIPKPGIGNFPSYCHLYCCWLHKTQVSKFPPLLMVITCCESLVTGCYFVPCRRVGPLINLDRDQSYLFHYCLHFKTLWKLLRASSSYQNKTELITHSKDYPDWRKKENSKHSHAL